jgi:hypothetical protein
MVKEFVPVKFIMPPLPNAKEPQADVASTVTVMPAPIVQASAEVGMAAPPQVAVLFQTPVTDAVLAAAWALDGIKNKSSSPMTTPKNKFVFLFKTTIYFY